MISYKELYRKTQFISHELKKIEDGIVGVVISNSIDYVIAYFSILFAGKVAYVMDGNASGADIKTSYCDIQVKTYIVQDELYEKLVLQKCIDDVTLITISDYLVDGNSAETEEILVKNEDALLLHTSGTSGKSKYVLLSHKNLMVNVQDYEKVFRTEKTEKELIVLPLTSAFINTVQLLTALYVGRTIVIYEGKISIEKIFTIIEDERIAYIALVPSLLRILVAKYDSEKHDLSSLKKIAFGGESVAEQEVVGFVQKLKNVEMIQGYGMTEASPVITTQQYGDAKRKPGSVGKTLGHVQVQIVNEEGSIQPILEKGEVIVKGDSVIKRYYKGDLALRRGWFQTGDIGFLDEDGYLFLCGRRKNIIISAGRNINPEEVENVIMQYGGVEQVRVFGSKNSTVGELVVAEIVADSKVTDAQLLQHCKTMLDSYKIPKKIIRVNQIKRNNLGKIVRN